MTMTEIHIALSAALFYSQFCRSVKMGSDTHIAIQAAFYTLTVASVVCLFAPIVIKGWEPCIEKLFLLGSILIVQAATARFWIHGAPRSFTDANERR